MQSQPLRPVQPAQPATSPASFSPWRLERLRSALLRHVEGGTLPGLVALVWHRGRVHVEVIGSHAFDGGAPMQRDTIFRLASMTKPITAVGAMILVEECRLRLDDPVDEWLPELKDRQVLRKIDGPLEETEPARRPITLRDLLTFRPGFGELGFIAPTCPLARAMSESRLTLAQWPFKVSHDEFMKALGALPLAHQPGERWLYHTAAEVLGVLIARVASKPLGTFLHERIFGPLGMKETSFYVPESRLHRLPVCYGLDFATGQLAVLDDPRTGSYAQPPVFESGAGGLVSTADDLLAFGRMMVRMGAYENGRILSRPAVELMTMDYIGPAQKALSPFFENYWTNHSWGLGLGVITGRAELYQVPGRFGWDGAFGTSCWIDPKEQLVGVLLAQRRPDMLAIPPWIHDFWTSAYQLIDD